MLENLEQLIKIIRKRKSSSPDQSYTNKLLKAITDSTNIPVIASGGVGTLDHLYDGIVKGGASAVLAASIFHYGEYKIKEAKEYLNSKNVSVRL